MLIHLAPSKYRGRLCHFIMMACTARSLDPFVICVHDGLPGKRQHRPSNDGTNGLSIHIRSLYRHGHISYGRNEDGA